jgi:hypothetical protein
MIDSLQYSLRWYDEDDEKADGGWSLELIDPQNTCAVETNWVACEDESGGTPGKQNSVYASKPDNTGPKLLSVVVIARDTLSVTFDEKLEKVTPGVDQFTTDPPLLISHIAFADNALTTLLLSLENAAEPGIKYTLTVRDLFDCPGNRLQESFSRASFVLPQAAVPGDIIINEILFNPRPLGVDFVEVYNASQKTIDLRGWSVSNLDTDSIENPKLISAEALLIYPDEYRVFTERSGVLKSEYPAAHEGVFFETDLPPFNDDAGSVAMTDAAGATIDSFVYTDRMHAVFIKDDEGVSLERISGSEGAGEAQNWRSASSDAGYATPGYINSNVRPVFFLDDGSVRVEPEIFQPEMVSQDFTRISYRFDQGGFVANIKIFDQQGRPIKSVAQNALLGTEGFFRWDGDLDNGSRARMGYYMVWFEIFNAEGSVRTFRKRVAIY